MAKTVEIKNFRGFKATSLPDCRRINIIVGDNGSGKTALMEAIFLAAGISPEIALRFRSFRGFDPTISGVPEWIERSIWGDLFFDHSFKNSVSVSLHGSAAHERIVTVTYNERNITIARSEKARAAGFSPVTFTWKGHNNKTLFTSSPRFVDNKIVIGPSPQSQLDASFFAANQTYPPGEVVNRFSALSVKSNQREAIDHFVNQFRQIEDLSVEMNAGAPLIYAKLKEGSEKLPLALISGGMNKLSSILFTMPSMRGGIVLIDEIENGFYYKKLPEIWRSILYFADTYDVQIFASTHSLECLNAAAIIAEENSGKFSVIHTGNGTLRQFAGEQFVAAMDENIEVR